MFAAPASSCNKAENLCLMEKLQGKAVQWPWKLPSHQLVGRLVAGGALRVSCSENSLLLCLPGSWSLSSSWPLSFYRLPPKFAVYIDSGRPSNFCTLTFGYFLSPD